MTNRSLRDVVAGSLAARGTEGVAAHDARYRDGTVGDAEGAARYYDLVTDFYEYGWGESFHFAPRGAGESLPASILRLEHLVARRLGLGPSTRVLDAGCGIGGPMRSIARLSGASVEGVTINAYQVERSNALSSSQGLGERCRAVQGDFTALAHADATFDAAYSLEAMCHVSDRSVALRELGRVVKPGGLVAGTDWCTTAAFRPDDPEHVRIVRGIEEGNGLAPLISTEAFRRAFADAGLELLEARDLAPCGPGEVPWYEPLQGGWRSATGLRRSWLGRRVTHALVSVLEATRVAPRGTVATSSILNRAADALVEGGLAGLFTPLFFFCARVPGRGEGR